MADTDHMLKVSFVCTQVVDIGIGQRYGIMFKRPQSSKGPYSIRASTMTHQTYQGTAILKYGEPKPVRIMRN